MLSKVILTLLAATSALAAPGGSGDSWGGEEECSTTCSTELCTESSVYQKTTAYEETKTIYIPVTNYATKTWAETKTYTSTETKTITTSTPYTTVIWQPYTTVSVCEEPYTTVCDESSVYPVYTSSATVSICTEETVVPYTSAWVETSTYCSTITQAPSSSWGNGGNTWGTSTASGW